MLPIFPLNTVLLPGGVLPLRVFETRYMDMVRDCLKKEQRFGVCLIQSGVEVARQAEEATAPEAVGCTAEITDWHMKDLGVLNIRTLGRERFRILTREVQTNGLILAQVEMISPDATVSIEADRQHCVTLLASIIAELEQQFSESHHQDKIFPINSPYEMADAAWVSNRLCEVLPIPMRAKQRLMELEGGAERLEIVDAYLRQHKIV
jgi:Lon protease-like protein